MEEKIDQILLANFKEGDWQEARKQLLLLFSVSGSFTAYDMERAYDDGYSTEGEVNFDIENYR